MSDTFDFLCVGSGPAGQKAAIQAAKAGYRTAIIERDAQVGGSCLLSGTIPSKALRYEIFQMTQVNSSVLFREHAYAHGPGGAKGIGELPMDGPAPAIGAALADALDVVLPVIPYLPERLLDVVEAAR
jgi:NADPH-dependent 2,4-dienoyl-CoA reductase/sulfur reductase-like enzyme